MPFKGSAMDKIISVAEMSAWICMKVIRRTVRNEKKDTDAAGRGRSDRRQCMKQCKGKCTKM